MTSKGYVAAVVALLVGLLLGSWAPQADLRTARGQIAKLEHGSGGRTATGGAAAIQGVQSLLNLPQKGQGARADVLRPAPGPRAPSAATNSTAQAAVAGAASTQRVGRASFSNQLDQIRGVWTLRAQIARTNFISRADLNAQQAQDFEVLVAAMNLRLGTAVEDWVAQVHAKDAISSEDGVRILGAVSSAMVQMYNDMDRKLPPSWREAAGPKFELVNFVDPDVLAPLEDVSGLIDGRASRRSVKVGITGSPPEDAAP